MSKKSKSPRCFCGKFVEGCDFDEHNKVGEECNKMFCEEHEDQAENQHKKFSGTAKPIFGN